MSYRIALLLLPAACQLVAAGPLSLSIKGDRATFEVGDPIDVVATLTNDSDRDQWINFGRGERDYTIDVRDANGVAAPDSAFTQRLKHSVTVFNAGPSELPPGNRIAVSIEITKFVDLAAPGTYSVQLSREIDPSLGGEIQSNVLVVDVLPSTRGPSQTPRRREQTVPAVQSSGPLSSDFSLKIEVDRAAIPAGREIRVYAVLTNVSHRAITIPSISPTNNSAFNVEARMADGGPVPETPLVAERRKMIARLGETRPPLTIAPGSFQRGQVDVASRVQLGVPGTYNIQLWMPVPDELGGGEVRSNELTLVVTPAEH